MRRCAATSSVFDEASADPIYGLPIAFGKSRADSWERGRVSRGGIPLPPCRESLTSEPRKRQLPVYRSEG